MPQSPPPLDPTRLLELMRGQRDLYRRLGALGARQRTLVSGDQPEQLLSVLSERHALISALSQSNQELAPYRRSWETVYGGLNAAERKDVAALLAEINGLLHTILQADQEDSALLGARKQSMAQALQDLSGGQAANAAYGRAAGAAGGSSADLSG